MAVCSIWGLLTIFAKFPGWNLDFKHTASPQTLEAVMQHSIQVCERQEPVQRGGDCLEELIQQCKENGDVWIF